MKARLLQIAREVAAQPWRLWTSQVLYLLRIELRKNLFGKRGIATILLAGMPLFAVAMHALNNVGARYCSLTEETRAFATIFQFYYLRLGIFFGAMAIFTWLVRGDMVEGVIHYYLLAPMRRELLVIGKFLAGVFVTTLYFSVAVVASFSLLYWHFGPRGSEFIFYGPGLGHLGSYLLVTVLACVGYGALFLALSLIFKNPAVPGAVLLGWETLSGLLPSIVQKLTVTYYLKHLSPVPVPASGITALFTVVSEPVAPWVAVIGLLMLAAAVLTFACFRIHAIEISYQPD